MYYSRSIAKPFLFMVSTLALSVLSSKVSAHGYMAFPQDYANSCAVGSTTDPTLCNATVKQQKNEISRGDAAGWHQEKLLDGQICSATKGGDYRVLDIPSPNRYTNQLKRDKDGKVAIKYHVTAKHKTWYWDYFITRDGFNPETDKLTWADLERIDVINGNGQFPESGENTHYVNWPADKTGKRILFQIWQRPMKDESGGLVKPHDILGPATDWDSFEAFYSCANVNVIDDNGGTPPPPPGGPWSHSETFASGNTKVDVGYTVVARIMNEKGTEQFFVPLTITADNMQESRWKLELAEKINQDDSASKFVRVGVKNDNNEIVLNQNHDANAIYFKDMSWSHLIESQSDTQHEIKFDFTWQDHNSVYRFQSGDEMSIPLSVIITEQMRQQGKGYSYNVWLFKVGDDVASDTVSGSVDSTGPNAGVITDTLTVPTEGTYRIKIVVSNGQHTQVVKDYHTEVVVNEQQPETGGVDYIFPDGLDHYVGGTKVLAKDGHVYQCKLAATSGFCKQWKPSANAFEPGLGHAWEMAWSRLY